MYSNEPEQTQNKQPIAWKKAAIGLAIGVVVGALLTASSLLSLGSVGTALAITATGLVGASFGINPEVFRKMFDKASTAFKEVVSRVRAHEPQQNIEQSAHVERDHTPEKFAEPAIATAVFSDGRTQKSGTYHADQITAERQAILLGYNPEQGRMH